jgi:hypothetical protein
MVILKARCWIRMETGLKSWLPGPRHGSIRFVSSRILAGACFRLFHPLFRIDSQSIRDTVDVVEITDDLNGIKNINIG